MTHDIEKRRAQKREASRRYAAKNLDKVREAARQYAAKNYDKDKRREQYRKWLAVPGNRERKLEYCRNYRRLKPPEYTRKYLVERQANREFLAGRPRPDICDICAGPPRGRGKLHYDHCHRQGHFRGWLCHRCNVALGLVEDDPRLLVKMIAYLQRTQTDTSPQFSLPGI